jgi:hypothetical protein
MRVVMKKTGEKINRPRSRNGRKEAQPQIMMIAKMTHRLLRKRNQHESNLKIKGKQLSPHCTRGVSHKRFHLVQPVRSLSIVKMIVIDLHRIITRH